MSEKNRYNMTIQLDELTLVVFDTNAWLDLYDVPIVALEEIVNVFRKNKTLFWIPHQVNKEYWLHSNDKKKNIINLFSGARGEAAKVISQSKDKVLQKITTLKNQNHVLDTNFSIVVEEKYKELMDVINQTYEVLDDDYRENIKAITEQDILDLLFEEIYKQDCQKDFTTIEKMKICEEGEIRFKYNIPPGCTDYDKRKDADNSFRKYGDLIIWKELLRKVERKPINTIFVENEKKKDWLSERGGNTLAKVLLEEYEEATEGKGIVEVCDLSNFIEHYGEELGLETSRIEELVKRLKFEKKVYDYVESEKHDIAREELAAEFDDAYSLYEVISVFFDTSVYGGNFQNAENVEIHSIDIESCDIKKEKDSKTITLTSSFEIHGNADIEEYISREVSYSGNSDFSLSGTMKQIFSIIYNDLDTDVKKGFSVIEVEIDYGAILFFNTSETCFVISDE